MRRSLAPFPFFAFPLIGIGDPKIWAIGILVLSLTGSVSVNSSLVIEPTHRVPITILVVRTMHCLVLIGQLYSDDPTTRENASYLIGQLIHERELERLTPLLARCLSDESPLVRARIASVLAHFGKEENLPDIIHLIQEDPDEDVRLGAVESIYYRNFGPPSKEAIPALIEALPAESPRMGFLLMETLGSFGRQAAPRLAQVWKNKRNSLERRKAALDAFTWAAQQYATGVRTYGLEVWEATQDPDIGDEAVEALAAFARAFPQEVRTRLKELIRTGVTLDIRVVAAGELETIDLNADPKLIRPVFEEALRSQSAKTRVLALIYCPREEAYAERLVPLLTKLIWDKDPQQQLFALQALESFGANAKPALPEIQRALQDPNYPNLANAEYTFHSISNAIGRQQ